MQRWHGVHALQLPLLTIVLLPSMSSTTACDLLTQHALVNRAADYV
jgi:hypothetical protein